MTTPTLDGFTTHYGVPVSWIGEDGDAVALGHHEDRRALAAFAALRRRDCPGEKWYLTYTVRPRWAQLLTHCEEHPGCGTGCETCGEIADSNWCLAWVDADRDGAFPVMHWS